MVIGRASVGRSQEAGRDLDRRAAAPVVPAELVTTLLRHVVVAAQDVRVDLMIMERRAEAEIMQSRKDGGW
jgi:hypothetical protein